jgi:hypothetical protein
LLELQKLAKPYLRYAKEQRHITKSKRKSNTYPVLLARWSQINSLIRLPTRRNWKKTSLPVYAVHEGQVAIASTDGKGRREWNTCFTIHQQCTIT